MGLHGTQSDPRMFVSLQMNNSKVAADFAASTLVPGAQWSSLKAADQAKKLIGACL